MQFWDMYPLNYIELRAIIYFICILCYIIIENTLKGILKRIMANPRTDLYLSIRTALNAKYN